MRLLFTDLDGCLLNKQDYDYTPSLPVLDELRRLQIPVILCSSKTYAEMSQLQQELQLTDYPMTCENGGLIAWSADPKTHDILGAKREEILVLLKQLKPEFPFRSFADLGLQGVMEATSLPEESAAKAIQRGCTEPLLWDGEDDQIIDFGCQLQRAGFTLTKGGRFWHVAGKTTKGLAMSKVIERYQQQAAQVLTAAVGDSPIDQSMLDVADCPIGIPQPDRQLLVKIPASTGIIAGIPGSAGWAEAVKKWLS